MIPIREYSTDSSQEDFVRLIFEYVVTSWGGDRFGLFCKFTRLFQTDISAIVATDGYMHCTTMNYLIRVACVKSGLFHDEDIQLYLTHTWYMVPHQYLKVSLNDGSVLFLDPWNYQFGIEYGDFGSGFDSCRIFPIRGFSKK